MPGRMMRFLAIWFIGAAAIGLLVGRIIKGPGETPALFRSAAGKHPDTVEEKAG